MIMKRLASAFRRAAPSPPAKRRGLAAVGGMALVLPALLAVPAGAVTVPLPDEPVLLDQGSGSISGVVVDVDGRPYLGAIVQLYEADDAGDPGPHLRPAFTGVDGRYRIDDLPGGCYAVVVEAPAGTAFGGRTSTDTQTRCLGDGETIDPIRSIVAPTSSAAALGTNQGAVERWSLQLIHVGHHLGQLQPSTIGLDLDGTAAVVEIGGWARVVAAVRQARPADAPESTITLHTGGVLGGSALSHLFGGATDADLMGHACFDYLAPSPEDRARPAELDVFLDFLDDQDCSPTVLGPGDGPATGLTVATRPVGTRTVGLITVAGLDGGDGAGPVDIESVATATTDRIEELAGQGVTAIVVLSGLGLAADRELAAALPEIDAIVGGGPGSLLGELSDLGLASAGPYPTELRNADGDPVCLGHAGDRARAVGHLSVELDIDGTVVACGGRIQLLLGRHLVTGDGDPGLAVETRARLEQEVATRPELTTVDPDLATNVALARWTEALDLRFDDPVATVTDDLCRTTIPSRTVGILCGSGDEVVDTTGPRSDVQGLVADAFRHRIEEGVGTGGDPLVAIIASDSVVAGVEPGPMTIVDAYRLLPGEPSLVVIELSGAELRAALEEGIAGALASDGITTTNPYPHTSGLRWKPDLARGRGDRVGPIEVAADGDGGWLPVEPDDRVRVVTTADLVTEDSPYTVFADASAEGRTRATTIGGAEALVDYVDDELGGLVSPDPVRPGP